MPKTFPPPKPLFRAKPVFRRAFTHNGKLHVAEFHQDHIELRRFRGQKRHRFSFTQLMNVVSGQLFEP